MTSASELFHSRRSRIGRPEIGLGSSSHHQPLSYNFHDRHHHNRRRHHQHRTVRHHEPTYQEPPTREEVREEMEECDLYLRRSAWHPTYRDYGPVQVDHLPSHVSTGNSSSNGNSSSRANRMHFSRSDQLPGDVLLARERLFERLRGVSLSSNRQSSRLTPGVPWDEVSDNDDLRLADTGELDLETWFDRLAETSLDRLAGDSLFSSRGNPINVTSSSQEVRPPGLTQQEISSLLREAITIEDGDEVLVSEAVRECSICLDSFHKGDELICLACQHKFHTACLCPWVRICGDCPNCRAAVVQ